MEEEKWISVHEMLPQGCKNTCAQEAVLVYSETQGPGLYGIARISNGAWEIVGNQGAHTCTGFYDMVPDDITHWRIIPINRY